MKRRFVRLLLCCFTLVSVSCFAQQRPYYTQYILNNYIINPAVAGIENYWDLKASHRMQWVGLQDAPVTTYFSIHGPLKRSAYDVETPTSFHAAGENPRGNAYWQDYQRPENHTGVGMAIINDHTGPLSTLNAYGSIAYHLGISPKTNLSLGLSAGFTQVSLDASKLDFTGTGNNSSAANYDPAVLGSGVLNTVKPDISAGLWLYSKDYFVGLAAQQVVASKVAYTDKTVSTNPNTGGKDTIKLQGKLVPHMFFSAGYRFSAGEDFTILPSTQIRYIDPLPIGVDLNVKIQYQDIFWIGASYRIQDGFAGMVGLNVNGFMTIGYSYDYTTSELNQVSHGSHEIVLGFLINNKYGDWCPRNLW